MAIEFYNVCSLCACMCVCVHACMCVLDGEGSMRVAIASTALVVAWMAVHLTGYSDHLTGLSETLSPPYRCHTGFKKGSTITGSTP